MTAKPKYWSCELWGVRGSMGWRDGGSETCQCSMCDRWRQDRSKYVKKKKKS